MTSLPDAIAADDIPTALRTAAHLLLATEAARLAGAAPPAGLTVEAVDCMIWELER